MSDDSKRSIPTMGTWLNGENRRDSEAVRMFVPKPLIEEWMSAQQALPSEHLRLTPYTMETQNQKI